MAVPVLIAADHSMVRQSLQWMLSQASDVDTLATAEDRQFIVEGLRNRKLDVAILRADKNRQHLQLCPVLS